MKVSKRVAGGEIAINVLSVEWTYEGRLKRRLVLVVAAGDQTRYQAEAYDCMLKEWIFIYQFRWYRRSKLSLVLYIGQEFFVL